MARGAEVESINKDRETSESIGVVDDTSVKKVEIKDFDVSATLDGPADSMEALNSVSRTPGAGVIQTEASIEMADKLREVMESAMEDTSSPSSGPSGRRMGGGVTSCCLVLAWRFSNHERCDWRQRGRRRCH